MQALNKELILVFGCPGSGKSTFARWLAGRWYRPVLLISGDEVEAIVGSWGAEALIERLMVEKGQRIRESVGIGRVLFQQEGIKLGQPFDPELWQQSRRILREYLPAMFILADTILIEDDMLLRSMRKPFKAYCADNNIHYSEILMKTSLHDCLKFNLIRGSTVPEEVIKEKFQKLQPGGGIELEFEARNKEGVLEYVKKSLKIPQKPKQIVQVEYDNELQRTDIAIRKMISQIMSSDAKIEQLFGRNPSKKEVGYTISQFKKQYNLKQGASNFQLLLKEWLQYRNQKY